jgi:aspartyl-tRNA(Asn)/glutamyl-tRNA(Gln) amidotransferase subunit A
VPSAFTGGFGLKPTFGRVPAYPASPFGLVAHVGPMTRNVADAAAMLEAMARPDPRDWLPVQGGLRPGEFSAGLAQGVAGLKVAFSPALGRAAVDPTIAEAVARAARLFADMGADVEAFDPPLDDIRDAFLVLWTAASAQAVRHLSTDARARLDPGLQDSASRGRLWSAMHMTEADMVRVRTGEALARFLTRFDLLLTPTVPVPALPVGRDLLADGPDAYWIDWSPFSLPFNFSRQPAATVPCGVTATGLPIGLQIVGAAHRDALVLRAAAAFERAAPFASAPLE